MTNDELDTTLKLCKESALMGYKIASAQYKNLNRSLSDAVGTIESTLRNFNSSSCRISSTMDMLSKQLVEIESEFNNLSFAFKDDLEALKENLSKFSITLFGRTMAGKSTLMEILTKGSGESIGTGAQRTTRDVRKYMWNGLEITDVPGIGAFEGEDDEKIAFEAAKKADLILFLITDDAPQATEAECFGKIVDLGKPVICIMNVKVAVSKDKSVKLLKRDIDKRFDRNRLNEIRKQFLSYANQLGQEWNNIPFVYVHLKSAFMAQTYKDSQTAALLYDVSRIEYLTSKIKEQVCQKGNFYRIKTFIDIISNPILNSMECILNQSLLNSSQGKILLSKSRQLVEWQNNFEKVGRNRIHSLIITLKSQLEGEIAVFAEEHYEDKNADKAWNLLLKEKKIQDKCQELLTLLEAECNDKIMEISREINQELSFTIAFDEDRTLKMNSIFDARRAWDWSVTIIGGGLSIAWIVSGALSAAITGPLGWTALAVSVLGVLGSFLFENKDKKIREARVRLENNLKKNIHDICDSIEKQMLKNFSKLIKKRVKSLIKELDRMNDVIFKLADMQKKLAWRLDEHLLELNFQVVNQAIKSIHAEGLEYHILKVARIPGNIDVFMLNDGIVFPEEQKEQLSNLMSERIKFVYFSDNKRVLISRMLGKSIDRNMINIDEKIGVADIQMEDVSPNVLTRIRLAQQFAQIAITK